MHACRFGMLPVLGGHELFLVWHIAGRCLCSCCFFRGSRVWCAGFSCGCSLTSPDLAILAGPGGALFVVSDAVLALMFFSPIRKKWLPTVNLATYYAAQILLAFSILAA